MDNFEIAAYILNKTCENRYTIQGLGSTIKKFVKRYKKEHILLMMLFGAYVIVSELKDSARDDKIEKLSKKIEEIRNVE
jgi:hypothetical protein